MSENKPLEYTFVDTPAESFKKNVSYLMTRGWKPVGSHCTYIHGNGKYHSQGFTREFIEEGNTTQQDQ